MLRIRRDIFYTLFLVILLVTEFYYISIGAGVARIYHLLAVVVVLSLANAIFRLFRSAVFLALLGFSGFCIISAFFSDNPAAAFSSLTSLYANIAISMAVAMMLLANKLSMDRLMSIIIGVTIVSVIWGLLQILVFKAGSVLALSPEQIPQILRGFGPAFRTEANTFGKYMVFPFLLFLPAYLRNSKDRKLRLAYGVMIIGIFMNFTRSALFGLMAALLFAFLWYLLRGELNRVFSRSVKVTMAAVLGITLILNGAVQVSTYARFKLENFFNQEEILEGGSSAYRIASMEAVIDDTVSDSRRLVIGNGWGQTHVNLYGRRVQAGGGDWVNVLGFGGLLGSLFYLLYSSLAFFVLVGTARRQGGTEDGVYAEGLMFAFVGMSATSLMSGYLIAPEYWLLIGVSMYFGVISTEHRRAVQFI